VHIEGNWDFNRSNKKGSLVTNLIVPSASGVKVTTSDCEGETDLSNNLVDACDALASNSPTVYETKSETFEDEM
jgi:hypothetical protein